MWDWKNAKITKKWQFCKLNHIKINKNVLNPSNSVVQSYIQCLKSASKAKKEEKIIQHTQWKYKAKETKKKQVIIVWVLWKIYSGPKFGFKKIERLNYSASAF